MRAIAASPEGEMLVPNRIVWVKYMVHTYHFDEMLATEPMSNKGAQQNSSIEKANVQCFCNDYDVHGEEIMTCSVSKFSSSRDDDVCVA